ncbi:hypothetical protein HYT23_05215 [Candidatus Pacearchaeota archaeon]|nr:hypothetical protein [Candidatus Pacearchaeota archaeon]
MVKEKFFGIFPADRTGWIRVVEAFVAVLLITGVLLVLFGGGKVKRDDPSSKVYEVETAILRDIQLNDSLRNLILAIAPPLESSDASFPQQVSAKINSDKPAYIDCVSKICTLDDDCLLNQAPEEDLYARSVAITSTPPNYKQLKLFCWMR